MIEKYVYVVRGNIDIWYERIASYISFFYSSECPYTDTSRLSGGMTAWRYDGAKSSDTTQSSTIALGKMIGMRLCTSAMELLALVVRMTNLFSPLNSL